MPKMARFDQETKKKNRFERALQTNRQTDIQTESTTKNSRLGAESTLLKAISPLLEGW